VSARLRTLGRDVCARFKETCSTSRKLLRAGSSFRNQGKTNNKIVKNKVLFICVQNSARSQIAAALLNKLCGDYYEAHSAGLEPGVLNPFTVEALQEVGIDISRNKTQSVFDVWKSARHTFTYAITVCSESEAEACPIFAGVTTRLHWSFDDPSKFTGTHEERLEKTRRVRDEIRATIDSFCEEHCVASKA
jgi:arsenate reductase (thioredoxin)